MTSHVNCGLMFEEQFFKQLLSEARLVLSGKSGCCLLASGDQGKQVRMVTLSLWCFLSASHGWSTPDKKAVNKKEPLEVTGVPITNSEIWPLFKCLPAAKKCSTVLTLLLIFSVEGLLRLKGKLWSNLHMSLNWTVSFIPSLTSLSFQTAPLCFYRSSLESNCLARANVQTTIPIFNLLGQQKVTLQHSWKKLLLHYNLLPYEKRNSPNRNSRGVVCFQGLENHLLPH